MADVTVNMMLHWDLVDSGLLFPGGRGVVSTHYRAGFGPLRSVSWPWKAPALGNSLERRIQARLRCTTFTPVVHLDPSSLLSQGSTFSTSLPSYGVIKALAFTEVQINTGHSLRPHSCLWGSQSLVLCNPREPSLLFLLKILNTPRTFRIET